VPLDRVDGELEDAVALIVRPERRARDADDESHDVIDADVVASGSRLLRGDEQRATGLVQGSLAG